MRFAFWGYQKWHFWCPNQKSQEKQTPPNVAILRPFSTFGSSIGFWSSIDFWHQKMQKCNFLKILQCPDFEILWGHSHHQDIPKNHKARHGTFFFIRITFSSHVRGDSGHPDFLSYHFCPLLFLDDLPK